MICTLQPVSFSQQKQDDRGVSDAQGNGPLQTSKPSLTMCSTTYSQLSEKRQGKARRGKARHNVALCVMEHT